MSPGIVRIYLIPPIPNHDDANLTEEDLARAATFRFPDDAIRWKSFRAGVRRILGANLKVAPRDVKQLTTAFGKPVLAPPFDFLHFNLAHCDDLALLALSVDGPVGVDLEPLSRAHQLAGCEATFCHPQEIETLPVETNARHQRLLELWTAKEALLKSLGTGLSHPPDLIQVVPSERGFSATSDAPLAGISNQTILPICHPLLALYSAAISGELAFTRFEFTDHE